MGRSEVKQELKNTLSSIDLIRKNAEEISESYEKIKDEKNKIDINNDADPETIMQNAFRKYLKDNGDVKELKSQLSKVIEKIKEWIDEADYEKDVDLIERDYFELMNDLVDEFNIDDMEDDMDFFGIIDSIEIRIKNSRML